jgi:flagellar hook-basal body complex protein FliE
MTIDPIRAAQVIQSATSTTGTQSSEVTSSFKNYLLNSLSEVSGAEGAAQDDVLSLAMGTTDGLHNITINAAKADLAIETMVSVRNKALDAYNEIMRITL